MPTKTLVLTMTLGTLFAAGSVAQSTDSSALPPPGFHHLHLNSTNPEAAIDYYTKQFPSTSKATWGGKPVLKSGKVYVMFNKVSKPPTIVPQSAIWHFGWHVTDVRERNKMYLANHVPLLPLYTGDGDAFVYVSSDTWPGTGGTLGRTKAQIAEAKATGVKPAGGAGFAYLDGPDHAIIEYQGNMPVERFNHVHMYQDEPFCAQLWYEKHLNARAGGPRPRSATYRSQLQSPANSRQGLARAGQGRHVSHSGRRRPLRRCIAELVHQSGRQAARQYARSVVRSHRAQCPQPGSLDQEAEGRKRQIH